MTPQPFPTVELVFVAGCPHADQARAILRDALGRRGLPQRWMEWNQDDPAAPDRIRGYGSPTILVAGRDVTGAPRTAQASACRADGLPTAEVIGAALARIAP
jgi:mercuric ion transport protein